MFNETVKGRCSRGGRRLVQVSGVFKGQEEKGKGAGGFNIEEVKGRYLEATGLAV